VIVGGGWHKQPRLLRESERRESINWFESIGSTERLSYLLNELTGG
jgi:hypothetical protein